MSGDIDIVDMGREGYEYMVYRRSEKLWLIGAGPFLREREMDLLRGSLYSGEDG